MLNKVMKQALFGIYCCRGQYVNQYMEELGKTERFTKQDLESYKTKKLHELLSYVFTNNRYYKQMKSEHHRTNKAAKIKEVLSSLPVLTKDDYRKNLELFIDNNIKQDWKSTSGTTGTPFVFPKDRVATGYMDAMMHIAYTWHDVYMLQRQARLWGRALKRKEKLIQKSKDLLLNRKRLSAFEMNDKSCLKYYNDLCRFKPKYFYTYSNALYQFALFVERNKLDGKSLKIPTAICTGEVLFPYQREKIVQVFGCRVVNEYGSTENGIIGFECEYGKMHVLPTVFVEIMHPDNNGLGEIVITELNSRSLPFIRYSIGDIGRIVNEGCACPKSL